MNKKKVTKKVLLLTFTVKTLCKVVQSYFELYTTEKQTNNMTLQNELCKSKSYTQGKAHCFFSALVLGYFDMVHLTCPAIYVKPQGYFA